MVLLFMALVVGMAWLLFMSVYLDSAESPRAHQEAGGMEVTDTDVLLEIVYLALLRHPHDKWRAENQAIYAAVRDSIARRKGVGSQTVQDLFEQVATEWE